MSDGDLIAALRALVAIERDRELGYPRGELHMAPDAAIQQAVEALEDAGESTDELLYDSAREALDIQTTDA